MKKNNRTLKAFWIAAGVTLLSLFVVVILLAVKSGEDGKNTESESVSGNTSDNMVSEISENVRNNARENNKTSDKKTYTLDEEELIILHNAYASALSSICEGQIFIDDKSNKVCNYLGYWTYLKKPEKDKNKFAITDVDGDGVEELIVEVNNADVATKITVVYQYDFEDNSYYREASFFPGAVFYDNDIVFDEWSHNTGNGSFIWPYSVYKYDRADNAYYFISQVDSWTKDIKEDGFPDDVDKDQDGNIVVISSADETLYLDNSEYYQWITKITEGSSEKVIEFNQLIPDNYLKYVNDYISYMIYKVDVPDNMTDVGVIYALSDDSLNDAVKSIENICDAEFKKSGNKQYSKELKIGDYGYFGISAKDGNAIIYSRKYEGISIFGLYPGMKEKKAISTLKSAGFTAGDPGVYKLGSEGWHVEVLIECNNDEVEKVTLCWNSDYAK